MIIEIGQGTEFVSQSDLVGYEHDFDSHCVALNSAKPRIIINAAESIKQGDCNG